MGITATGSDFDEALKSCISKKYGDKYRPASTSRMNSSGPQDDEGRYRVKLIGGMNEDDKHVIVDAHRTSTGWEMEFLRAIN